MSLKALRMQKHALSQSSTPSAECTKIARFSVSRRRFLPLTEKSRDLLRPQDARFPLQRKKIAGEPRFSRATKRGCFKRGGCPIWTCPSFFVLFCPFWDFPDFSGIFPICSGMVRGFSRFVLFLLLGLFKSTYEEQSRKGPRHNLDLSPKKWETPGFGNPPV